MLSECSSSEFLLTRLPRRTASCDSPADPSPRLHRIAHRQREHISSEIARQGWSGKRLLIVIIIIPSRPVRQVLGEFNRQRRRRQMIVVTQRPGGRDRIQDECVSGSARHGVTHRGSDSRDRLHENRPGGDVPAVLINGKGTIYKATLRSPLT